MRGSFLSASLPEGAPSSSGSLHCRAQRAHVCPCLHAYDGTGEMRKCGMLRSKHFSHLSQPHGMLLLSARLRKILMPVSGEPSLKLSRMVRDWHLTAWTQSTSWSWQMLHLARSMYIGGKLTSLKLTTLHIGHMNTPVCSVLCSPH